MWELGYNCILLQYLSQSCRCEVARQFGDRRARSDGREGVRDYGEGIPCPDVIGGGGGGVVGGGSGGGCVGGGNRVGQNGG